MRFIADFMLLTLLTAVGMSYAAPLNEDVLRQTRQLYTCAQFFEAGLYKGSLFEGRTKALSIFLRTKAASILVDSVDRNTSRIIMDGAADDYRRFSSDLGNTKEGMDRNRKQREFSDSCIMGSDVKIDDLPPLAQDPQRFASALKTYACYSFILKVSQSTHGDPKEKSRKISTQLLLKATQLSAPTDGEDSSDMSFLKKVAEQGEAEVRALLDDTPGVSNGERKTKLKAYYDTCASMVERP